MELYQPAPHLTTDEVGAAVLAEVCRKQHVHQLKHEILGACNAASTAFTWLRLQALQRLSATFLAGLQDPAALRAALEQSYSQVLEVVLSTLDRPLISGGVQAQPGPVSSSCPAGYAPHGALGEEWRQAYVVLQALCLFHSRTRQLMGSAQYLQMLTAHACACPPCLSPFMDLLLSILAGAEEAQALFVSTGGLETLLRAVLLQAEQMQAAAVGTRTAHGAGGAGAPGQELQREAGESSDALVVHLLIFLQVLLGWVIGEAVRKGAHPNTQKAAVQLLQQHLGVAAAGKLTSGLNQMVSKSQDVLEVVAARGAGQQANEKGEASLRARACEAMALLQVKRG